VELRSLSRDVRLSTGVRELIDGEKGRAGTGNLESFLVMIGPSEDMGSRLVTLSVLVQTIGVPKVESHVQLSSAAISNSLNDYGRLVF